jgi:hypothetical protein
MNATALPRSDVAVASARTLTLPPMQRVTAQLRRAVDVGGDVFVAAAVVLCIPFVVLAVGIPIALFVQLLIWIARLI